jgi:uncharacterized iron-regulated membrane protein
MRRLLVRLHLWLGVTIGLLWALQGLTGALLVFHRDIDRLVGPAVQPAQIASPAAIEREVLRSTGARAERIGIVDGRGDLLYADYSDAAGAHRMVLIEAASGRIVGAGEREPASPFQGSASRWLYLLHEALLLGEDGETLIGLSGLLLLSATATGLWIGWPRRRAWRAAFSPARWRSPAQRLHGWHRMVGIPAAMVLLVSVTCGVYMIFAAELRPAIARVVPHQLPYAPEPDAAFTGPAISSDRALGTARALFPGAGFVRLTLPTPRFPAFVIRLRQAEETRAWSGVTSVAVDPRSGAVLDIYDPLKAPLSNRLADAAFSIHSGEIAGLASRLLIFFTGLSLPALYVTGLLAWARKARRRRAKAGRKEAGPGATAFPAGYAE